MKKATGNIQPPFGLQIDWMPEMDRHEREMLPKTRQMAGAQFFA